MNLVLDIETDSVQSKIWMVVTKDLDTGELCCHTEVKTLKGLIDQAECIIGHNLIGFDSYHLMNLWKMEIPQAKCWDTLIVSRLLKPDIADGHSLEAWGRRLGSKKIDYTEEYKKQKLRADPSYVYKDKDEWNYPLLYLMEEYCDQDVELTATLLVDLKRQLKSQKFSDYSVELEHKVAWIVAQQVRNGVLIDQRALMLLKAEVEDELAKLTNKMVAEFEPTVEAVLINNRKQQKDDIDACRLRTAANLPAELLPAAQRAAEEKRLSVLRKQQGKGEPATEGKVSCEPGRVQGQRPTTEVRHNTSGLQRNGDTAENAVLHLSGGRSHANQGLSGGSLSQNRDRAQTALYQLQHSVGEGKGEHGHTDENGFLHQYAFKLIPFNPGSRMQIIERLLSRGWVPTEFTEKDNVVLDEEILKSMDIPEAKVFLRFFELQKINSFLTNWDDKIEPDGRIHGRVITNGAVTGRMTHSSPNLGQVPSAQTELGKRCRALFIVPEGCSMLGIDASGLELRMLAHYMQDQDYIKAVCEGKSSDKTDVHSINQRAAGLDTRDQAKTFIYAFLYGAGAEKIGSIAGGGSHKGRQLIDTFLEGTPALQTLREKVKKLAEKGSLPGLDGRRLYIRSPHKALNTLLQGAGAAVMKEALCILVADLDAEKVPYKMLINCHDEWQIETPTGYAEQVGKLGRQAIQDAGQRLGLRCPLDGEYKIGKNWYETH